MHFICNQGNSFSYCELLIRAGWKMEDDFLRRVNIGFVSQGSKWAHSLFAITFSARVLQMGKLRHWYVKAEFF